MKRTKFIIPFLMLAATTTSRAQNIGTPTPIPPATTSRPHGSYPSKLSAAQPGETVLTFETADVGHPVTKLTHKSVTFELASPLRQSQAEPRVMFFPHLMTERKGILNAMATEQAIPVKITFPLSVTSVTLVLWGSTGCHGFVEAHGSDGKLLDSATLEKVPERLDPSDPIPSFELTVKGENIAYVLFGGAKNGEFLAAEEVRFLPASAAPSADSTVGATKDAAAITAPVR